MVDVALTWARRASKDKSLSLDKLSKAKVASYDAIYYEKDVKTKIAFKAKWRQWVFTVKNRCYLILSILSNLTYFACNKLFLIFFL